MSSRRRGNWSTQELERLRSLYPRCGAAKVAELLGRSEDSVRRRAVRLFDGPTVRGAWTEADDAALRLAYGAHDCDEIARILRRPAPDVERRLAELAEQRRRGPWSRAEEALLKRLYGTRSEAALAVCLSRSPVQIERKASELCLAKDKRCVAARVEAKVSMPRWQPEEVQLLRRIYPHHGNLEVARQLSRSVTSVANKASQLGLKKSREMLERMGRDNVSIRYRT